MGCLVELTSRLALLALWLATPWVNRAFSGGWILPLLGIIFLPITALSYVIVYALSGVSCPKCGEAATYQTPDGTYWCSSAHFWRAEREAIAKLAPTGEETE